MGIFRSCIREIFGAASEKYSRAASSIMGIIRTAS
jgi:hypothetical protein